MIRGLLFVAICAFAATNAIAQSDTLPSASSTAGVSIQSIGRSLKPQELTPTGPRMPPTKRRPSPDDKEFSRPSHGSR